MTRIAEKQSAITIKRDYKHPVAKVFAAFAQPEQKAKWFGVVSDGTENERFMDCRTGGREVLEVLWPSGVISRFDARYSQVTENSRLVYTYDLFIDGKLYSVSLADVIFEQKDGRTSVSFAETTSYYEEQNVDEMTASRLHGTTALFDMMEMALNDDVVQSTIDNCH